MANGRPFSRRIRRPSRVVVVIRNTIELVATSHDVPPMGSQKPGPVLDAEPHLGGRLTLLGVAVLRCSMSAPRGSILRGALPLGTLTRPEGHFASSNPPEDEAIKVRHNRFLGKCHFRVKGSGSTQPRIVLGIDQDRECWVFARISFPADV